MPDPTDVQAMTDAANGTGIPEHEALGKAIYIGYFNDCEGRSINGDPLPLWEDQRPEIQQHWRAAARAAVQFFWAGSGSAPPVE